VSSSHARHDGRQRNFARTISRPAHDLTCAARQVNLDMMILISRAGLNIGQLFLLTFARSDAISQANPNSHERGLL
jgi:hypothetical protein